MSACPRGSKTRSRRTWSSRSSASRRRSRIVAPRGSLDAAGHDPERLAARVVVDGADRLHRSDPARSAALEGGGTLLQERLHALAEVRGLRRRLLELGLELELLLERRRVRVLEELLRHGDARVGSPAYHAASSATRASNSSAGTTSETSPQASASLRRQAPVRDHPLERAGEPEQAVDEPRAARVRDEPDADEARARRSRRDGGDANVAGARERQPGAGTRRR